MNKLKYIFSHGAFITFVFAVIIIFITCTADNFISQINSAKNGIEVLLVDTALTVGNTSQIEKSIKEKTKVKYVGVATLESSEAQNYVNTIENYTLKDYIFFLLESKNAEILVIPQSMLKDAFSLNNIVEINGNFDDENCYIDGKCYAVPLDNKEITISGGTLISAQESVYGIIINGDRKQEAEEFLLSLKNK